MPLLDLVFYTVQNGHSSPTSSISTFPHSYKHPHVLPMIQRFLSVILGCTVHRIQTVGWLRLAFARSQH